MLSNPADKVKIKKLMTEISNSYTRIAAEKDLIKEMAFIKESRPYIEEIDRLRSFINQKKNAISHGQYALHFTTEIGVTGCVHDVNMIAIPIQGCIFRKNRNTTFFFNITRVHHALIHCLVSRKRTSLL